MEQGSFWLFMLIFRVLFTIITCKMAEKRNRSTIIWGLFSFFISPIFAWLILAILGNNNDKN